MSLKQKTITGLTWSFIDNFSKQGLNFIIGIILARLLLPSEFGLIGMITIFIAISQSFIDSGFKQALIRKTNCTQIDYSTVFFFNLAVGILFFFLLFFSAGAISRFFAESQLKSIVQILSIGLVFNALAIIQVTQLTKAIDFKLQARISVIATFLSGIIGIAMAYSGQGVWSLAVKNLTGLAITSLLLWLWVKWRPSFIFSYDSFRQMFSFGSKLLFSGLLDTIYGNILLLMIGKFYSATDLGYYTRANQFSDLVSQNINTVIQRVSYPVLSTMQDDISRLKMVYQRLIKSIMFITFVLMLGLAAVAKPLVLTLIGAKWLPSVIYLQLLCFAGMLYPLHALNLNMLNVLGRSDLFLRLEIIKKVITIPFLIIGIFFGIKILIMELIVLSIIIYFLNSYWSGVLIGYNSWHQIQDIAPSFFLAASVGLLVYLIGNLIDVSNPLKLVIQVVLGAVLTVGIAELFHLDNYLYMKSVLLEKIGSLEMFGNRSQGHV